MRIACQDTVLTPLDFVAPADLEGANMFVRRFASAPASLAAARARSGLAVLAARAFSSHKETAVPDDHDKLHIFDTTLRDGEQSPGATLTADEKVEIGKQLAKLGVDICEAGFPIASQGDFEAVKRVAESAGHVIDGRSSGLPMRIAGLSRANERDIDRSYDAVRHAPLHRVHTFLASSDIHLEHKLGITRAQCVETSAKMVAFARSLSASESYDIEFSPEDAGRSDPDFLVELCAAVIEAGATTINLPDTVGYTLPNEYGALFAYLIANTDTGGKDVVWSTHCHDDLGLATANSLAAVQQGARQIEVTLNGIGERAGNTSLEETVMALRTRPHLFPVYCDIETTQIMRSSKMVSSFTGIVVQANKAIVGANAFAHESGIHQHGVLKHSATYEIIGPETIGLAGSGEGGGRGSLVLGKHSGKAAYRQRLIELGYEEFAGDAERLNTLVQEAKSLADRKKTISDDDLHALVSDDGIMTEHELVDTWQLGDSTYMTSARLGADHASSTLDATATVMLRDVASGREVVQVAHGAGPVDATYKAILAIVDRPVALSHYLVNKIEGGSGPEQAGNDALASVVVEVVPIGASGDGAQTTGAMPSDFPGSMGVTAYKAQDGGTTSRGRCKSYSGTGTSTDIVVASARAYVSAINRMLGATQ